VGLGFENLQRILDDLSNYNYIPMTKKKLMHYFNTMWLNYALDAKEKWAPHMLNFPTIL
jgi:hypothetical protein